MAKKPLKPRKTTGLAKAEAALLADVRKVILDARQQIATAVNAALTMTYWHVGDRIRRDVLNEQRAEYGEEVVGKLGQQLEKEFGRGFGAKNLLRMVQFVEVFPDLKIVATLSRQLGWSHFKEIIPLKDSLRRDFYAEMCRVERWSVRALRERIGSMLFERTAISKKPEKLIEQELKALRDEDRLTPDLVFRDPYFLDFLGLKDTYSEKDLESAILPTSSRCCWNSAAGSPSSSGRSGSHSTATTTTLTCSSTTASSAGSLSWN